MKLTQDVYNKRVPYDAAGCSIVKP